MNEDQLASDFWGRRAAAGSRFLTESERELLRTEARRISADFLDQGSNLEAGRVLRIMLELGGATTRELDLIGLAALQETPTPDQAVLMARLVLRHLEDGVGRLPLTVQEAARLRGFFSEEVNQTQYAIALLSKSRLSKTWLFLD